MNGQGKLLTHYLKNADKLIIPVYQRNYDWREEHCKKLYQDLVRTIQNKKRWHFFGGIVSVSDPMGSSSDYLVIDGQQRITTVSLLLLAMANLIKDGKVVPEDDTLYAQITKKYLVDEINPKNRKVKLKPIKGDQDAYDRLWGDPENFARSSNITQNYLFFYNEIQKQAITIDQLFKAVEKLQIIDITLTPPDDDPQLVFESLNSTGLELNEGDKIRNFVLMGLDIEEQERYYDSYWNPIEKNAGYDKQNNSYLNYLADADDSVELSIHVGRTAENYSSCVKIDEDIYVWTGTATQYKINLLRKFFEQYKQDPSDLVFFLDDAKDTGSEDEAERHKIRRKYWEKALPLIQKTTGSFQNANPQKNNAVYGGTNKPGVLISCVANFDSARVEIYIDQGDYDKNRTVYRLLENHRSEIETAYGKALTWVCQDGVRGCRIYDKMTEVSITKEDDWDAMVTFHTQQAKKLLSAMQPYLI